MRKLPNKGFTLLEMMVGLILLAIGIVGFSGMTIMMARGNRQAATIDEAATLVQSTLEEIGGEEWCCLGTDTLNPLSRYGLASGNIRTEGPLNRNGDGIGTGVGPYRYYRYVVICKDLDDVATGGSPKNCGGSLNGSARPEELTCTAADVETQEKIIRVMVSWFDRAGRCHWKKTDSLQYFAFDPADPTNGCSSVTCN